MDCRRRCVVVVTFLLLVAVRYSQECDWNEVPVRRRECATEMTCNSCKVCSPCLCKDGYIREWPGRDCISEDECHDLHLQWLAAAKYDGEKNTFFNCDGRPRRYRQYQRTIGRRVALHPNQVYSFGA